MSRRVANGSRQASQQEGFSLRLNRHMAEAYSIRYETSRRRMRRVASRCRSSKPLVKARAYTPNEDKGSAV